MRDKVRDLKSLLDIIKALTVEKNLEEILKLIIRSATQVLDAERSSLFLYDEDSGELYTTITDRLEIREIRIPADQGIVGAAASSLAMVNIPDAYEDERFNPAFDHQTGFRTRAVLAAPLLTHEGKLIGVIQVLNKREGVFNEYDEELLGAFCTHAAIAIDNANLVQQYVEKKRLERSMQIAREVQQNLIPSEELDVQGVDVAYWYSSCESVGGDYYDFIQLDENRFVLVVADVSGHGLAPALLMAEARALIRATVLTTVDLVKATRFVNDLLIGDLSQGRFITCVIVLVDLGRNMLDYVSAGHTVSLFYDSGQGAVIQLETTGIPLGIMPGETFELGSIPFKEDDLIVLYTDGLIEAFNRQSEVFGCDRLVKLIAEQCSSSCRGIIDCVRGAVASFIGDFPLRDDVTLVAVRRTQK